MSRSTQIRLLPVATYALLLAVAGSFPVHAEGDRAPEGSDLFMFVTSTTGPADLDLWVENTTPPSGLSGLAAGDKICQVRADASGLSTLGSPVYRAWLSTAADDAYCHVQGLTGKKNTACNGFSAPSGPWVRTDGVQFSGTLDELVTDGPLTPPNRTESNAFVSAPGIAWTGTQLAGTAGADQCSSWNSTVGAGQLVGAPTTEATWTDGFTDGCGNSRRLYCFESGAGSTPNPPVVVGSALIFVSSEIGKGKLQDWTSAGGFLGLAGGDQVCQTLAFVVGLPLPSSYLAWLSDASTATDAVDRFSYNGPRTRVDGFAIANNLADLTDFQLQVAPRINENYFAYGTSTAVWTGTLDNGNANADHCVGWTDDTAGQQGLYGFADQSSSGWSGSSNSSCSQSFHLYCVGDQEILFWDGFERGDTGRW